MTTATATLYLSRIVPDLRSRKARYMLGRPGQLYAGLLEAFAPHSIPHHDTATEAGVERGLLYRVEQSRSGPQTSILVQSNTEPDWLRFAGIHPETLAPEHPPESKEFSPDLLRGDRLRFRLRANPTKSLPGKEIAPGKRSRGRVIAIQEEHAQLKWLEAKLEGALNMESARVIDEGRRCRIMPSNGQGTQLRSALFDGFGSVENPERLRHLLACGVGRGRAYGFGLLSLART